MILPSGWNEDRIKDVVIGTFGGGTPSSSEPEYFEDGDIVWITPTDFSRTGKATTILDSERKLTHKGLSACSAILLPPGTVIMSSRASIGVAKIAGVQLATNQGFISFICEGGKLHNRFFRYAIESHLGEYFEAIAPGTTFKEISRSVVKQARLRFPLRLEQERIAAYLDASCAAIDVAVSAKQKQIETLAATGNSLIHDAVTQGLNPSAAMQPTGLDWNGQAPAHWRVRQIKRMCALVRGQFTHRPRNDPALYDGPYPFIQTGDITAARKYIRSYSQTLNELGLSVSKMFPKGTLVMSIAANIGDVAILDFEACFPDSMIGMIPNADVDLHYLYYLMRAMKPIMLRSAVLSTQLNLNYVRIGVNFAAFPPIQEQRAIAKHLETKEEEIASIRNTLQSQIDTLTAYRKSLIHECVTGQRRITEADLARVTAHA